MTMMKRKRAAAAAAAAVTAFIQLHHFSLPFNEANDLLYVFVIPHCASFFHFDTQCHLE